MTQTPATPYRHIFGPVPSRRLGRSLGVDLVPFKTCTYDCVYCQLGRTTDKTVCRREYVPLAGILQELESALGTGTPPDYLTLAGSGEPTLFRPLDKLLAGIKRITDVPVVILTNGSLLWDPQVRAELALADVIMPSLDAGDDELFQRVNRPHAEVTFERLVEGLIAFRREFAGAYWLEVMLLAGLTDQPAAVQALAAVAREIDPDRIYLNTAVRPPAESWAKPVSTEALEVAAAALGPRSQIIAEYESSASGPASEETGEAVLALLRRRPCRLEDLANGLGLHRNEIVKYLGHLQQAGQISSQVRGEQTYYSAVVK